MSVFNIKIGEDSEITLDVPICLGILIIKKEVMLELLKDINVDRFRACWDQSQFIERGKRGDICVVFSHRRDCGGLESSKNVLCLTRN